MKLLRETIQQLILKSGMMTHRDLPEDAYIRIREAHGYRIYVQIATRKPDGSMKGRISVQPGDTCWGTIICDHDDKTGVWVVRESEAGSGWGPLLYDTAMEYATQNGEGLMSDRFSVSDGEKGAVHVWDYYLKHRVGRDVEAHQMDDNQNTLTPTDADNVLQAAAKMYATPEDEWMHHSLSKRYTKSPTTIEALGRKVVYE